MQAGWTYQDEDGRMGPKTAPKQRIKILLYARWKTPALAVCCGTCHAATHFESQQGAPLQQTQYFPAGSVGWLRTVWARAWYEQQCPI